MRYKLAIPLAMVLGFGVPAWMISALVPILYTQQYDFAALCFFVGGGLSLFVYENDKGYRIAWDNDHVYMREWGFANLLLARKPFKSIAYKDIGSIALEFGVNALAKSKFIPYEFIKIYSSGDDDGEILIYPLSLKEKDFIAFLQFLYTKNSAIFPEKLIDLMRQDGLIE